MIPQLTRADLANMTPEQIDAARKEGRLDTLLGRATPRVAPQGQLTRSDLEHMTPEQLVTARADGRLGYLLTGATPPAGTAPDTERTADTDRANPGPTVAENPADQRVLTRGPAALRDMTPDQIATARADGQLQHLGIGRGPTHH